MRVLLERWARRSTLDIPHRSIALIEARSTILAVIIVRGGQCGACAFEVKAS